jgi:hypothetical protein
MASGHEAAAPWPAGLTDAPEERGAWIIEKLHIWRDDRGAREASPVPAGPAGPLRGVSVSTPPLGATTDHSPGGHWWAR